MSAETNAARADINTPTPGLAARKFWDRSFVFWGVLATGLGLAVLTALVWGLISDGAPKLSSQFFTNFPSQDAAKAGILSAWVGSLLVILTTALIALPLGVAAGVYLEEYARKSWMTDVIEVTVNNLAGVPSIIYGLLGLGLFVYQMHLGQSVLVAGMTLAMLVLPVIIVTSREAVRAVPRGIREAALAVGATKWQATSHHVLPYATPGIITGVIIALSRALGETAPLIVIGLPTFVAFLPFNTPGQKLEYEAGLFDANGDIVNLGEPMALTLSRGGTVDLPSGQVLNVAAGETVTVPGGAYVHTEMSFTDAAQSWLPVASNGQGWLDQSVTVLPMQMFNWTQRPEPEFLQNAAAAGIVLLSITLLLNGAAIWLRYRLRKQIKW